MNRLTLRLLGAMLVLTLVVLIVVPTLQWFAIRATLQQLPSEFRDRLVERTTPQLPLGRWVRPRVDFDLAGSAGATAWTAEEESARLMVLLSDLRATQRRSAAIGLLVSLVLCAWVAVTSARSIAGPIESVSQAAAKVARGSLATRVDLHRFRRPPEEALRLGQNFNVMAEALERSERRRTAMIADVAHDLRTPLAILQLRLEAAADGLVAVDPAEVGRLLGYVTLLTRLTNDLRLLASADAGRLTLRARPVELHTWLEDTLTPYRTAADRRGVTLTTRLPGGALHAHVDPDRLQEVVHNVMDNALRHTPAGGQIEISLAEADGRVELVIADAGPGFPPDRLAQPLGGTDAEARRDRGGSTSSHGLGLAIVHALVALHGGTVQLANRPGGGAEVRMRFGTVVAATQATAPASQAALPRAHEFDTIR